MHVKVIYHVCDVVDDSRGKKCNNGGRVRRAKDTQEGSVSVSVYVYKHKYKYKLKELSMRYESHANSCLSNMRMGPTHSYLPPFCDHCRATFSLT